MIGCTWGRGPTWPASLPWPTIRWPSTYSGLEVPATIKTETAWRRRRSHCSVLSLQQRRKAGLLPVAHPTRQQPEPAHALLRAPLRAVQHEAGAFQTSIFLCEVRTESSSSTTTDDTFLSPNRQTIPTKHFPRKKKHNQLLKSIAIGRFWYFTKV